MSLAAAKLTVVLVTGLSGAGKNSILRTLEDLGFETMDNPPLAALEDLAARGERKSGDRRGCTLARFRRRRGVGHDGTGCGSTRICALPWFSATATDEHLLRRYSETRRRHPLAQDGKVADGIAIERCLTEPLAAAADVLIDTSSLPLPGLRKLIEQHFGAGAPGLSVTLVSFAYPAGLPGDADLVFDARFLRNPYYDEVLRPLTGLDPRNRYVHRAGC